MGPKKCPGPAPSETVGGDPLPPEESGSRDIISGIISLIILLLLDILLARVCSVICTVTSVSKAEHGWRTSGNFSQNFL